mmetsp:Transcript_29236/g.56596  ORF Transcript_29236/g.56596 Transcript_29236/m.56596 type:complete len:250 (+) Transcript_29236:4455-5204(+)
MRTARAEIGQPGRNLLGIVRPAGLVQRQQTAANAIGVATFINQNLTQLGGNLHGVQRPFRAKEHLTILGAPIDPAASAIVKDRFLDLHFDQLALFLHHNDQVQPLGPVVETCHIQRPGLAHLVGCNAKTLGLCGIDVQQGQRMNQIKPVLARRHQTDLGPGLAPNALVHLVGIGKRLSGVALVVDQPGLLINAVIDQTNVQPTFRHRIVGRDKRQSMRIAIHDRGYFNRIFHGLQPDPHARKPTKRNAV